MLGDCRLAAVAHRPRAMRATFSAAPLSPAMAWIYTLAQRQKSFGSFLQKRTLFNLPAFSSKDLHPPQNFCPP
jgi:hypothetical protein